MDEPLIPPPGLSRVDGARSPQEMAQALIAGANAPNRLSWNPRSGDYDPTWTARVRAIYLNGQELTDVVSFDINRGEVEVLLRDARGKEKHEYVGEKWDPRRDPWPLGRLAYRTTTITAGPTPCPCGCGRRSHVSVKYGIPIRRER